MRDKRRKEYTHKHTQYNKIIRHLNNYHSHTTIMRGSLLLHCSVIIHITYMTQFTFIFVIQHIFLFMCSVFLLHNSDRVFLMSETIHLCGGSAHTLMQSHIAYICTWSLTLHWEEQSHIRRIIYVALKNIYKETTYCQRKHVHCSLDDGSSSVQ